MDDILLLLLAASFILILPDLNKKTNLIINSY